MSFIHVDKVSKNFGQVQALKNVEMQLEKGGQYVIQGASGSGKSTLLYLLGGLDRPDQGHIYVEDKKLDSFNDAELARFRNLWVGLVFQFHFLLPSMSCLNNTLLPAKIGGADMGEVEKRVHLLAKKLGVEHCLKKSPFELSGGEQQRVNIIRALSLRPKLLLCDEPTGNLDSENSLKVVELLKGLAEEFNSTLVIVTHDEMVVTHFAHRYIMKDGQARYFPL